VGNEARNKEWQPSQKIANTFAMRDAVTATGSAPPRLAKQQQNISGCSAVGSAPALGARHRPLIMKSRKTPKALVNTDFFGTLLSRKILYKSGLTTCLTTYGKKAKNEY